MKTHYVLNDFTLIATTHVHDLAKVSEYYKRNKQHLCSSMPEVSSDFFTVDFWQEKIRSHGQEQNLKKAFRFFLVDKDLRVIGHVNFDNIIYGPFMACYLGYGIDAEYEGKGLMHSALSHLCEEIFSSVGLNRIMANCQPNNFRSLALLAKLGFEKEGYARKYLKLNGEWRDHVLTSLLIKSQ